MMLRRLVCVLLVRSLLGLGVDDTEKRRSEEILRAVSAAATADYEGLQQMKFQKSQTVTRLESAINTRRCVTKLIEALNKEQATLSQQGDTMLEEKANAETQIDSEKVALQQAIQEAIKQVYGEVERRYIKLKAHSGAMMDALKEEVEDRTSVINGESTPEKLFEAIMENAAVQLNAHDHNTGKSYRQGDAHEEVTGLDPAVVQQYLARMMLHSAVEDAYEREYNKDNTTTIREDSYDYINMENLLLMAGTSITPDAVSVDDQTNYQGGEFNPELTTRTETGNGTWRSDNNVSSTVKPKNDLLVQMFNMKMTNLEKENLKKLERQFVDWTVAKSEFHNVSIQKSAVDSALDMVKGKIGALETSLQSIKIYDLELLSLEDDEMRRIADIKEEFESLAADWLQLATYHCCDIIQGNTVECTDATAHLMQPINNVFPGALKAPDPARDCVRRLL